MFFLYENPFSQFAGIPSVIPEKSFLYVCRNPHPYPCRNSSFSRNPFCPTTHILSAKAGALSAPLQESFQSNCRNIFCPTTCILSANIFKNPCIPFKRIIRVQPQVSFCAFAGILFERLQETYLFNCRIPVRHAV